MSFCERHDATAKILKLDECELASERFADQVTPAATGSPRESSKLAFELPIETDGEG